MANSPNDSIDENPESNTSAEEVSIDTILSVPQKTTPKSRSSKTLNRVMIFEKEN
jgi:hypothetical protein